MGGVHKYRRGTDDVLKQRDVGLEVERVEAKKSAGEYFDSSTRMVEFLSYQRCKLFSGHGSK